MIEDNKANRRQSGPTLPQIRIHMFVSCSSSLTQHKSLNSFASLLPDVLLIIFVVLASSFSTTCHASCNQIDRDALISFSLNVSASSPLNWSSTIDCCTWEGVDCDGNDRVTRLWLPSRALSGTISPSITSITHLSQINLSNNLLSGPLPDRFFSSFESLEIMDLSYNRLSGELELSDQLPPTIKWMNISGNRFNGTIPTSFLQSAINLEGFNVRNNSFSGPIPSFLCNTSRSITQLDFSYNDFTGQISQAFGGCSNLEILAAGFNNLSGSIPTDIYRILTLQEIFLPANKFSGSIDGSIVNLINIRVLALYANELTGTVPQDIGRLSNLEELLLHINMLNGKLPRSLMNCTSLRVLNLRVNSFQGELSSLDFSKLVRLETVDLGNNNFTGRLPASLFSCRSLTAIRLATNNLTGEVLSEIQALDSLSFLSLSNNSLTNIGGALRILMGCKNLATVILSKNFYDELLPDDNNFLSPEGFQNLQILGLGGCRFTGQIPAWLTMLSKIEVVDLSFNHLTGNIPDSLGTLPNLFYIDLSENFLGGFFPEGLIKLRRLASQQGDDLVQRSYLELPVFVQPNNASNLQYNQLANLPPAIYLRSNNLSGNIPTEIGQLRFVHVLDFSNNNFSGSIPESISNLTNLEILDLSKNQLSGEIPASLKNLHFLSSFSVANNNLEGTIPTGGQFDTFPNTSFLGNPMLCGSILQRPCPNNEPKTPSTSQKSPRRKIIIWLVVGICFGIAFALTMLAYCMFSKRRILPKGEKTDLETVSFNSGMSVDVCKEASQIILFPDNIDHIKDLTISEILKATDNFNQANIIGCGGFGLVYKATLSDGTKLAIKKLSGDMGLMEREFKAEVEALSTAQHQNLVSLRGYCVHDGTRLLIYSYMENGSLDYWLHEKTDGPSLLDWPTRLKIAQGASCGVAYMHQICEPHIVHRDIKSSNILLDEKFEAHVADFGLARLILPYHTHVTTELVGTLGYIPPEYSQQWIATLKGDVYSFGVVMLELLTGKRPVEVFKPKTSRELVAWVQQMRNEGKQDQIFDPLLRGKGFEKEMLHVLDVACLCVNQNPMKRPTINEVVVWLKNVGSNRQEPKEG